MKDSIFFRQAELVLRILPAIQREPSFALKGGTAINFFVRNLPRLSVDIDLAYLPIGERDEALQNISNALTRISGQIERRISDAKIVHKSSGSDRVTGLVVRATAGTVKVEPNLVIRGSVFDPEPKSLCPAAQDLFEMFIEVQSLSTPELYGAKICAALDRQHPRDLFDLHLLLKNDGITDETRKTFIVYLISHPRPMVELLDPGLRDIRPVFEREFQGMARETITCEELEAARSSLISILLNDLTDYERQFIVSVKEGRPLWTLLGLDGIRNMPAVKWKLMNIERMDFNKHREATRKLRGCLGV